MRNSVCTVTPSRRRSRRSRPSARRALEQLGGTPTKIRLIHGYGAEGEGGVLRDRLRAFCDGFDGCLKHTRGEDVDGNMGIDRHHRSEVPARRLERLGERVVEYCVNGRTRARSKASSGRRVRPW